MQLIRRFHLQAAFCAIAVLFCELISKPFTSIGIDDDAPYILMARTLASTGHIAYNGWATAMLGWQLYLGAAFIKLFGFSFTTVRMSTLLVAMLTAFLLQRTLIRTGIIERNATLATLALVLSPLYLMLSATFMSDIDGLFAIVICLYGCLRALQSSTSLTAIAWICFAVITNVLCGTARQIAWLGVLVMVPSALWLLRGDRRVLFAGAMATFFGFLLTLACMQWFKHQPYVITVHFFVKRTVPLPYVFSEIIQVGADIPFLLLPVMALFLLRFGSKRLNPATILAAAILAVLLLVAHFAHIHPSALLEPAMGDWVNKYGLVHESGIKGDPPIFLTTPVRVLLSLLSLGGLFSLAMSLFGLRHAPRAERQPVSISWQQLAILLVPFAIAYLIFLLPHACTLGLSDRYLLGLLAVALPFAVRFYQERILLHLPPTAILLVAIMAIYAIAVTHNTFAFYRARAALADEINAAGLPQTSFDNGWEYNVETELQHADHINYYLLPANVYVPTPPLPPATCPMVYYDETPHIHPLYSLSFNPNFCYGPAPFDPVHYSRWLTSQPGTLYVVRSVPYTKP